MSALSLPGSQKEWRLEIPYQENDMSLLNLLLLLLHFFSGFPLTSWISQNVVPEGHWILGAEPPGEPRHSTAPWQGDNT